jgi:hypothetical protein
MNAGALDFLHRFEVELLSMQVSTDIVSHYCLTLRARRAGFLFVQSGFSICTRSSLSRVCFAAASVSNSQMHSGLTKGASMR